MLSKIIKCRSGNFGLISAIALLPIMLSCGVAVDVANLIRLKSNLQNANDAAAFMAAHMLDQTGALPQTADVKLKIEKNLGRTIDALDIKMENKNLVLTSRFKADLVFGGILPSNTSDVSVLSAVNVEGARQLDVVLVLDNTYSMVVDGKIDALKKAAADFVKTMMALNKNDETKVRIGIVPFANYVNVGINNRYAKWMSVPADTSTTEVNKCWPVRGEVLSKYDCHPVTSYNDGVPQQYTQCSYTYGPDKTVCGDVSHSSNWHGCVGSRDYPLNLQDTRPDKPFPGIMDVSCPSAITPLTADQGALNAQIAGMRATGETYIADGVIWGLRVLSDMEPFTEAATSPAGAGVEQEKIMILMTDGDNSRAPQLPNSRAHGSGDVKRADDWTKEACAYVKASGVSLYTISFGRDVTSSGKSLMAACADPEKFYDASAVSKINDAFQSIAGSIAAVRLTQ